MERKRHKSFLEKTAQAFALPADVLAGLPAVRLVGRSEVYVQNHRGILAYGEEEILISGGAFVIRVRGTGLNLATMTPEDLVITGEITGLELG